MVAKLRAWFAKYQERHPTAQLFAAWARRRRIRLLFAVWMIVHLIGAGTSIHAILNVRTAQGTIAWFFALNAAPFLSVPAYWIFGRSEFRGYIHTRREDLDQVNPTAQKYLADLHSRNLIAQTNIATGLLVEKLANWRFTLGNDAQLLVDGEAVFKSIFEGIERATNYVLVEYYIFRNDKLGAEFKERLVSKARQGVKVYLLLDEMGSPDFRNDDLREEFRSGGINLRMFNTRRGADNYFQINFRNHRKIVVVDGVEAWVGGLNVGDEYLGRDPKFGAWRDTHTKVSGPVAQGVQMAFLEDWNWASGEILKLNWDPLPARTGANVAALALPTGPADRMETCTLFFLNAINLATNRLWIATPYFVPDEQFVSTLQLAALRGVDVRILVPGVTDNKLVQMSGWSFLEDLEKVGIKTYRYTNGFMHQKVAVIDDLYSAIGTANFDNRSFRLNFEITMAFADRAFSTGVRQKLEKDFSNSEPVSANQFRERGFWYRFGMAGARLMAPVQ